MLKKHSNSIHQQTVIRWFSKIFISISLAFLLLLLPLFASSKNNFSDLQIEKRKQLLNSGATRISSTVSGMINVSKALRGDSRFTPLKYPNSNYKDISLSTQHQLQAELENLTHPYDFVSHTALHLNEDVTITDSALFFENQLDYYPNFFQVNDLSYEEWMNLLSASSTGFTPVCHIKTYSSEYDALIFVTPWTSTTYLYTCINVNTIKQLIIEEESLDTCYFTITSSDNTVLYSDLPNDLKNYETISEACSTGRINISVHIPNSVLFQNMKSFYVFILLYAIACIMLIVSIGFIGTKQAAKPVMNILNILEHSRHLKPSDSNIPLSTAKGFDYISDSILNAEQNLEAYQSTFATQQKVLQARFIEKAINGQLVSKNDIQDFHSYFPNFPEKYRMLLIKLWSYTSVPNTMLYQEPLLLLHSFLGQEIPCVYQQQINDTELLMILNEEDYENSYETLNFIINNINQEEPTYHAYCMASNIYSNLEDIPTAYQQLRAVDGISFSEYQSQICTVADTLEDSDVKIPVTMIDLMTLYTAIISGNAELSLSRLSTYSDELEKSENKNFAKPVYEVIKSMLTYIKMEYLQLMFEQKIPSYQADKGLYEQLSKTVESFCSLISEHNNVDKDSFTQELFSYIDAHYTDSDICLTSLRAHFKCSESTIRKVFKKVTDVPIARYIEQKRMILANDLLAKNELSVTEIALKCGYTLPHSFYKAYKRVYGHAPTLSNNTRGMADEEL